MDFKISHEIPPIYARLREAFGPRVDWRMGTVIAYGDTIYAKDDMPDSLIAHETTHLKQQAKVGVEIWWEGYIKDPIFRLTQEAEAYKAQIDFIRDVDKASRQVLRSTIAWLARELSSSMYGNMISYEDARNLLKQ